MTNAFALWIAALLVGLSAYWLGKSQRRKTMRHYQHLADYCCGKRDDKPKDKP